jgi:hypothetical protein
MNPKTLFVDNDWSAFASQKGQIQRRLRAHCCRSPEPHGSFSKHERAWRLDRSVFPVERFGVSDEQRQQIRLVLEDLRERAQAEMRLGVQKVFQRHSARGLLRSSMTAMAGARELEERLSGLVGKAVEQVKPVAVTDEAYVMIVDMVEDFIVSMKAQIDEIVRVAEGRPRGSAGPEMASRRTVLTLFEQGVARGRRELELHRFTFGQSARAPDVNHPPAPVKRNISNAGRPPAEFWDDMWAHIAGTLYRGDLQPRSQADIEKAMAGWIEDRSYKAAPSTVRARARRLWDQITTDEH